MDYTTIKGDVKKFKKRTGGFIAWTFLELCEYLGHEDARKKVEEYKRCVYPAYSDSKLVRDYLREVGDGFKIVIKTARKEETVFTDLDGNLVGTKKSFRNYLARKKGEILLSRKIILKDYGY